MKDRINSKGWNSESVIEIRKRLKLDHAGFAKLLGVDTRSVNRWETGKNQTTGSAGDILSGIKEKLDKDPDSTNKVLKLIHSAVSMGGLAYLVFKLLDSITEKRGKDE